MSTLVNVAVLSEAFFSMGTLQNELIDHLARHHVVARRDHPSLITAMDHLLRRGRLSTVLPGVYAAPEEADTVWTRVQALRLWEPDAVLTGTAAAQLTFWPQIRVGAVECALPRTRSPQPGYTFRRRTVPDELIVERSPVRVTTPALTALDLCPQLGGDGIDEVLRTRAATLDHLHEAMRQSGYRRGNATRRQLLLDSRSEPWSAAERRCHRLLRAAGITGWRANAAVRVDGSTYYLDIAFPEIRVAIEIDGRLHHSSSAAFEADRHRQNRLVLAGWRVLRFTWSMLLERPDEVVTAVLAAITLG